MTTPPVRRLRELRRLARQHPWHGQEVIDRMHTWDTVALLEPDRPTRIMLTYDVGYHLCGWWRNSDYDRCYHLSISHPANPTPGLAPARLEAPSTAEVAAWARAAFPEHYRWTWTEPPASILDPYRRPGVAHVRLFTDKAGRPLLPEGEVYDLKPYADGTSPEKVHR